MHRFDLFRRRRHDPPSWFALSVLLRPAEAIGTGDAIGTYRVDDDQMAAGSTLGAPRICMTIKASGAIEKVYSSDAGETFFGTFVTHFWDDRSTTKLNPLPGYFIIHPEHQEHFYPLPNGVSVHETLFVLSGEPKRDVPRQASDELGRDGPQPVDPPAAYYRVRLTNDGTERVAMSSYAFCQLRGLTPHDVEAAYDERRRAFVAWNESSPDGVRIFGVSEQPASYETTTDHAKTLAMVSPGELSNRADTRPGQDTLGCFALDHALDPGATLEYYYAFSFAHTGRADAERNFDAAPAASDALERTKAYYSDVLGRSMVMTPNPALNRGVLWAKANSTLR